MKPILFACGVIICVMIFNRPAWPDGQTFGLLSKSMDDENFIDTAEGCQDVASLNGDTCIHLGGRGPAGPRPQVLALKEAVQTNLFSAFAISVVMSDLLAQTVRESVKVPVMTFDSPFADKDDSVSLAYVGTDNLAFGRDLAKIVKRFRPQGGSVFLMGAIHDPNLARRIWGVRLELSGQEAFPENQRLSGEGGWYEFKRSPWNSGDKSERAVDQVCIMMDRMKPDVFISVGHWPIVDPNAYQKAIKPYYDDIITKKRIMVFGVGKVPPEFQAMVDEGLIHGLVSINFFEIGRKTYGIMRDLVDGKQVPKETYISNTLIVTDK